MRISRQKLVFILFAMLFARLTFDFYGCTHEDVDLEPYLPTAQVNETELISVKTTTPPVIDGTVDLAWEDMPYLETKAVVPDPGDNFYAGYVGDNYRVKMRSMYDAEHVYFLVEWNDPTGNYNRQPWYFNPTTKRWIQEKGEHTVNAGGQITRYAFGEDKFGVLWNIDNSVVDWNTKTCFSSCHTGLGQANGFARHYTNSATERIDMWHWKSVRDNPGNADDQYQDSTQPNGRKSDAATSGTGALDNRQTLAITGTSTNVTIPKYVIPGKTYYYWISKSEIDNGTAKLITAVDENGVLTYDGGVIDPNTDSGYLQEGATTGAKCIPSVTTSLLQGSRGDILAQAQYVSGKGWVLEMKRKLDTGDAQSDINFTNLADQYFGIGVFNNTGHSHAIKNNLILKFKK